MRLTQTKGFYWSVMMSIIILAMPMWALADNPGTPDIAKIKQMRQLQNQSTVVQHLKSNNVQVNTTAEQERALRLSRALSKVTRDKTPRFEKSYRPNLNRKDFQMPNIQQNGSREVFFNSGVLSANFDSLYFNFFTGMNSSDSVGMDVRITGNEGTNFGNEGASWGDPSAIYFLSDFGTLDTVYQVSDMGDPFTIWDSVSWAVNGYQPLAVGNLWVVFTRTSHMYVALEITNVDPWGQYFEFDYIIQDDGSNYFDMPSSLLDMTVNGLYADTLEIGSNPYFEITLDTDMMGEFVIFWDENHNGLLDDWDVFIDAFPFMDNDEFDENPADSTFSFTYTDEMADGLNYLADDLLFVTFSSGDYAETSVHFYSNPGPFSASGTAWVDVEGTFEPLPGIVVWAYYETDYQPAIYGVTDLYGNYHLDLPADGPVQVGSSDYFDMTDGLVPNPPMHDVLVAGHETGLDFLYTEPGSTLEGYVYDETGVPLSDIEVMANTAGPSFSAFTDEFGFYSMGVLPGTYVVEINWWSLPQAYMLPFSEDINIGDGEILVLDFYLQSTNSLITGSVQIDGLPASDAVVWAINPDFGYSATLSDTNGFYALPVMDDNGTLYDMGAHFPDMSNLVQVTDNMNIPAGSVDELIAFETLSGGLNGYFIDGETGLPIENTWEIGIVLRNLTSDIEYWASPYPDGFYEIWVPDGEYEVMAGGMNWYTDEIDTILIEGAPITYDVILWPIGFDTFFEGYVYDQLGNPIMDAQVMIGNENWGSGTNTDETGFYHFDVPYGYYYVNVMAEGFYEEWDEVDLTNGPAIYDFFMIPYIIEGVIEGIVYDEITGMPLGEADVYIFSEDVAYSYYTDPSGEFWFDLPNGDYGLYVEHGDYIPFWIDSIRVYNDTVFVDIPMMQPDGGLEGYVYDADTGDPIVDGEVVIVSTLDTTGFWGITDEAGYYSIPAMNGEYQVFAHAPEYEPADMGMITIADNWEYLDIDLNIREFAMPPEINYIVDQPFDQGRQVRMQFWPGGTEWGPFSGYSIWRLTNTPMGEIFDFVDYIPNHDFEAYNLVAPTLVDSSAYTPDPFQYTSLFMVTGHFDMYGYIDGVPAAGYSVDNIVPGIPGPLALLSTGEEGVEIGWEASMADDFQYFEVYRATDPLFTDAMTFATVDPLFSDEDVTVGQTYYYVVSAVDANGNVSAGTNMVSTSIVSIDGLKALPTAFGLSQNYPNPFNPTTSIEFALPEASHVSLEIYNLLGQKIRTLVNGYTPAGYISTSWDGLDQNGKELSSGTYIYRLETADMSFAKKMVLMK